MIHWGFLILVFIAGLAAGCAFLYLVAKLYSRVIEAIDRAVKSAMLR